MHRHTDYHAREMRSRVFGHMLKTRGGKYRAFLRYLRLFKYAAFAPARGAFLESYYVLMRYLDDVVDGDAPLPKGSKNESEYILEKIRFSENPTNPQDEIEYLMLYCFELAQKGMRIVRSVRRRTSPSSISPSSGLRETRRRFG